MATEKTSVFSRGNWLRCLIASAALPVVSSAHAAAGMRCDASEWVENSSQTNPRPAAYTVKAYTEGSDPFVP